jgi:F-type H+-transporting ATPase subunit gamma
MASLREMRKRIASVKNTQKITNAMKMVAAAKLRRAEEAIVKARPYSDKMREVIGSLGSRVNPGAHPMLEQREVKKALLILVTADRGLCGGFNANLQRRTEAFRKELDAKGVELALITVGRRGNDFFRRRQVTIVDKYINMMNNIDYDLAAKISESAISQFMNGEYDEVYMLYNRFRTAASQILTLHKLLPISPQEEEATRRREYLYEPSEDELLERILPLFFTIQIYTGLLDSVASEHGARMTAMEAATSAAEDMIHRLTLKMNRIRQESITTELMEIVSGAEALKG